IAIYLYKTFQAAMDSQWKTHWTAHKSEYFEPIQAVRKSFLFGMRQRLCTRLRELIKRRQEAEQTNNNCREIVLAKDALVTAAWNASGTKLHQTVSRRRPLSAEAYHAGVAAGNRVRFNQELK